MSKVEFRHAYSEPFRGSDLVCEDPSLAVQADKDESDINVLMERFKVTGAMPVGVRMPQYGDYTGLSDFRSALDVLNDATDEFMKLPAQIRARFGNDPQAFLEFCSDKKNLDQLREWGLAPPEVVVPPKEIVDVRVVSPEETKPKA